MKQNNPPKPIVQTWLHNARQDEYPEAKKQAIRALQQVFNDTNKLVEYCKTHGLS